MRRAALFSIVPFLALFAACTKDSDGDGISDSDEVAAGTDPNSADSDGDGVTDPDEETAGTDPSSADSDGDGLTDGEEADFGSDPLVADADGDGLNDKAERDAGSDPNSADTDADGYTDLDEVMAGTDPADPSSVIYQGGWPYNADKASLDGPTVAEATAKIGEKFAELQLVDQFGDTFDLYDMAGQGKPVVIDVSAMWCGPCNGLSQWLSGKGDDYGYNSYWPKLKKMVNNGDIYWVTVLGQNNSGGNPSEADLKTWDKEYPNARIPILADDGKVNPKYIVYGWPSTYFLDENMEIQEMPDGTANGHWDALTMANDYQP